MASGDHLASKKKGKGMQDQVSKICTLEGEGSRGAMAGEVSGSREDGKEGCSQPPLPPALGSWFLRLPPALCVNGGKITDFLFLLCRMRLFNFPPDLSCLLAEWDRGGTEGLLLWESAQHHKLPLGPGAAAGEFIQSKICTPALNTPCAHGGPLLFPLQVFLAAI